MENLSAFRSSMSNRLSENISAKKYNKNEFVSQNTQFHTLNDTSDPNVTLKTHYPSHSQVNEITTQHLHMVLPSKSMSTPCQSNGDKCSKDTGYTLANKTKSRDNSSPRQSPSNDHTGTPTPLLTQKIIPEELLNTSHHDQGVIPEYFRKSAHKKTSKLANAQVRLPRDKNFKSNSKSIKTSRRTTSAKADKNTLRHQSRRQRTKHSRYKQRNGDTTLKSRHTCAFNKGTYPPTPHSLLPQVRQQPFRRIPNIRALGLNIPRTNNLYIYPKGSIAYPRQQIEQFALWYIQNARLTPTHELLQTVVKHIDANDAFNMIHQDPEQFDVIAALTTDPRTLQQAFALNSSEWDAAISKELRAISKCFVRFATRDQLPVQAEVLPSHTIVSRKRPTPDNKKGKAKVRMVLNGSKQHVENPNDSYAPTSPPSSSRIALAHAIKNNLEIHIADVSNAFLEADLKHQLWTRLPPEVVLWLNREDPKLNLPTDQPIYALVNKAIYGAKVSAHNWAVTITKVLISNSWEQSQIEPTLFVKRSNGKVVSMVSVYVDDILFCATKDHRLSLLSCLKKHFQITHKSNPTTYLGITIKYLDDGIELNQAQYIRECIESLGIEIGHRIKKPTITQEILADLTFGEPCNRIIFLRHVGKLIFIAYFTRPDILFVTVCLATASSAPSTRALEFAIMLFRYLYWTAIDVCIRITRTQMTQFHKVATHSVVGIADASWGNIRRSDDDHKSVGGHCIILDGILISYTATTQKLVAQSTMEAEIIQLVDCTKDCIYFTDLLFEVGVITSKKFSVYTDSASALQTVIGTKDTKRTRHYRLRIAFLRDHERKHRLFIKYCSSIKNVSDIFTKPLNPEQLQRLTRHLTTDIASMLQQS